MQICQSSNVRQFCIFFTILHNALIARLLNLVSSQLFGNSMFVSCWVTSILLCSKRIQHVIVIFIYFYVCFDGPCIVSVLRLLASDFLLYLFGQVAGCNCGLSGFISFLFWYPVAAKCINRIEYKQQIFVIHYKGNNFWNFLFTFLHKTLHCLPFFSEKYLLKK